MAEQRYQAVLAVIADGLTVQQVADKVGVSRQSVHSWLARYEADGLEGLVDRSHRPRWCPHQMSAEVEAAVLELRRVHRSSGEQFAVERLVAHRAVEAFAEVGVEVHAGVVVDAKRRWEHSQIGTRRVSRSARQRRR